MHLASVFTVFGCRLPELDARLERCCAFIRLIGSSEFHDPNFIVFYCITFVYIVSWQLSHLF